MKRFSFTLLETLLAASILALIASTAFFWYRKEETSRMRLDTIKARVMEEANADFQLRELFSGVDEDSDFFSKESGSMSSSLVLIFNHGVHQSPYLSGKVLGELYLDADQRLILMVWPHPKQSVREPFLEKVILEGVESLSFDFYYPKPSSDLIVDPDKIGIEPKIGWQSFWERRFGKLPALVKLKIAREGKDYTFVYDLLQVSNPIRVER